MYATQYYPPIDSFGHAAVPEHKVDALLDDDGDVVPGQLQLREHPAGVVERHALQHHLPVQRLLLAPEIGFVFVNL